MERKWYQEKVSQKTTLNTEGLGFNRSTLNGQNQSTPLMEEPVNFKYAAFPNQSVLRQKDNYKSEGSGREPRAILVCRIKKET